MRCVGRQHVALVLLAHIRARCGGTPSQQYASACDGFPSCPFLGSSELQSKRPLQSPVYMVHRWVVLHGWAPALQPSTLCHPHTLLLRFAFCQIPTL